MGIPPIPMSILQARAVQDHLSYCSLALLSTQPGIFLFKTFPSFLQLLFLLNLLSSLKQSDMICCQSAAPVRMVTGGLQVFVIRKEDQQPWGKR